MRRLLNPRMLIGTVVVCSTLSAKATEPPLGNLIAALTGPDQRARAEARQRLPRHGLTAVPEILPLLASKDPVTAKAAFDILMDIGNDVSAPGRQEAARQFTVMIAPLIQTDRPTHERILGLRFFEQFMPTQWDVASLSPVVEAFKDMYQGDPILREKARTTLQRVATPIARRGLIAAMKEGDSAFKADVLNSLGEMRDSAALKEIAEMLASSEPAIRAAAARAVAWTGDPAYLNPVKKVVATADAATKFEAMDALIRLTNTIEAKEGSRQIALDTYLEILQNGEGVQKDAALAGLGRIGDGSCVAPILSAIEKADVRTFLTGIRALTTMQGRDVAAELVARYPNLPPQMQVAILPALGSKQAVEAIGLLKQAAASSDTAMRLAGLRGLANAGVPEGIEPLLQAGKTGDDPEKAIACEGLLKTADNLLKHHAKAEAGKAYLAACQSAAGDLRSREHAIEGLAVCPVPEAFDTLMAAAEVDELKPTAGRALVALGGALAAAGQNQKALAAYDKVRQLNPSAESVHIIAQQMRKLGANVDIAALLGIVTSWWVIGPFELGEGNPGWDIDYIGEAKPIDLKASYKSGDQNLTWKHVVSTDDNGKVVLRPLLADRDLCLGYAYAEVTVDKDVNALLRLGVDDSEKIWVNGKKVFEHFVARPLQVDQDQVPVKLKAGTNAILLKIWQNAMGWEFCLRITTPDGIPVGFEQKKG